MAEVLVQFDEPRSAPDGRAFVAQVWGHCGKDGLWEAWIEFSPPEGGETVRTTRETEQLTRGDLRYWAAGLTQGYLADALSRALSPQHFQEGQLAISLPPLDASRDTENIVLETNALTYAGPVLDPFQIYRQSGEYTLRQELRALHAQHLRDIIAAFDIPELDTVDLSRTFEDALADRIVAGVQHYVEVEQDKVVVSRSRMDVA